MKELIRSWVKLVVERYFAKCARARIHRAFPESTFVGPYERSGEWKGVWEEQWLWAYRRFIRGRVLDMSTPRALHEWVHELADVTDVLISDLDGEQVDKLGHQSLVDIKGDFCALTLPVPEASFDTILCLSVMEHCEDPVVMVKNLGRILRPGGTVFFLCPFAYIDGHTGDKVPDLWRFCRDGYLFMARQGGLEVIATGQYDDLGKYCLFMFGKSAAANAWHRGVPVMNWMICRRPGCLC